MNSTEEFQRNMIVTFSMLSDLFLRGTHFEVSRILFQSFQN